MTADAPEPARHDAATYWDAQAAHFDEQADHGLGPPAVRAAWAWLLLGRLPPPPAQVADPGCGTGSLSVLLAEHGCEERGLDISPQMVQRARRKAARRRVTPAFGVGAAAAAPFPAASFDAVACRHVLWALPDPGAVLDRWLELLAPYGRLLLVEGRWATGAGLGAAELVGLLEDRRRGATVIRLDDDAYWGGPISDERYLVVSDPRS